MGFGGSASAMIASMKNNKRNRSSTFKKMKEFEEVKYSELHFKNKATPKQLRKIREVIQFENKKRFRRKVIFFSLFFLIILYFVGFYKF